MPPIKHTLESLKAPCTIAANGCWEHPNRGGSSGYPQIRQGQRRPVVHRLMWIAVHGPITDDLLTCHKCDNRKCCNPDHLFLGTYKDNMADMYTKGRGHKSRGDAHAKTTMTSDKVIELRALAAAGVKRAALAKRFGISVYSVWDITRRRTWKHIP